MADGFTAAVLDTALASMDGAYVQVHSASPGAAGTSATISGVTTRKAAGFAAKATVSTNRSMANTAIVRWDAGDVSGSGTATHVSLWTAASGGTFLQSITLTGSKTITSGEPFEIAAGALIVRFGPIAS
jgi:hypothetical protein